MVGSSRMLAACLPTEMKSLALSPHMIVKGVDKLCLAQGGAREGENIPPGVLVDLTLLRSDTYPKQERFILVHDFRETHVHHNREGREEPLCLWQQRHKVETRG